MVNCIKFVLAASVAVAALTSYVSAQTTTTTTDVTNANVTTTAAVEEAMAPLEASTQNNRGWAGANSYFLQNFQDSDRDQVLDAMKAANLKLVRIFISATGSNTKNTNSLNVPDAEVDVPGKFNDAGLERVDKLMLAASQRGIKLIITLHDRWLLGYWGRDIYAVKYNLYGQEISDFYWNDQAAREMDGRFKYLLTHKNPYFGGRTWGQIPEAVFSIGIQNESQQGVQRPNFKWVCDRATNIRQYVKAPVLLSNGGGPLEIGFDQALTNCQALDVLSVHFYGMEKWKITEKLNELLRTSPKRFYVEEFGAMDPNKSSDQVKADNLRQQIQACKEAGVPWMFWQVTKPGNGPKDLEIWTDELAWQAMKNEAYSSFTSKQSWPEMNF